MMNQYSLITNQYQYKESHSDLPKIFEDILNACDLNDITNLEILFQDRRIESDYFRDKIFNRCLNIACSKNYPKIINFLLYSKIEVTNNDLNEALVAACKGLHYDLVKYLVIKGADNVHRGLNTLCCNSSPLTDNKLKIIHYLSRYSKEYYIPLQYACEIGHISFAKDMLDKIKQIFAGNLKDAYNTSNFTRALFYACKNGHLELVKILLPDITYNSRYYVFVHSCGSGNLDLVKYVISKFIHISQNDLNRGLWEAISIDDKSIKFDRTDVVNYLLDRGAKDYKQCLVYACKHGLLDLAKKMVDNGARNYDEGLLAASEAGHMDLIKFILSVENNISNFSLYDAYMKACINGDMNIIKFFISINTQNIQNGIIPACSKDNIELFDYLINNYPKKFEGYYGIFNIALEACCRRHGSVYEPYLIDKLISLGADSYDRCLDIAASHDNLHLVKYLLSKGAKRINSALFNSGSSSMCKFFIDLGADLCFANGVYKYNYINNCEYSLFLLSEVLNEHIITEIRSLL
jgi:ankyrin repeat protein